MPSLGVTIKQAREHLKMSQKELGERVGVWGTYIGQIEKGEKIPSDELCLKIAQALNLNGRNLLLCGYIERSEGEPRELFQQMLQILSDPAFSHFERLNRLGPELLKAFDDPDFASAVRDPAWRQAFVEGFRLKSDRDLIGLIEAVGKMKMVQWEALVSMAKALQSS
jgi:transcriptional regulator with XRE-family HTH domain